MSSLSPSQSPQPTRQAEGTLVLLVTLEPFAPSVTWRVRRAG
jgi:hypothetical protein